MTRDLAPANDRQSRALVHTAITAVVVGSVLTLFLASFAYLEDGECLLGRYTNAFPFFQCTSYWGGPSGWHFSIGVGGQGLEWYELAAGALAGMVTFIIVGLILGLVAAIRDHFDSRDASI